MSTGRARYSTVGLAAFFLATLALYILVRPAPSTPHPPDDPAPNTAVPTSTASSTTPTSRTERPSTSAPPGSPTSATITPAPTSGASDSLGIATDGPGPGEPGQR